MCPGAPSTRTDRSLRLHRDRSRAGIKNGGLLQNATKNFDVLLTVDRNLEYQQNFSGLALAVIVMDAPSNDIVVLRPLMPAVLEATRSCCGRPMSVVASLVTMLAGRSAQH